MNRKQQTYTIAGEQLVAALEVRSAAISVRAERSSASPPFMRLSFCDHSSTA